MAEREWNFVNSLSYLYNAFAIYTDAELSDEEMTEIKRCVSEWCPDKSGNEIHNSLNSTLSWFKEDLATDLQNEDSTTVAESCVGIAVVAKENLTEQNCKAIVNDLIRIGQADGNFDDREKHWANVISEAMGIVE